MSAAELMHRASVAGVEMAVSQEGRLKLRADFEPPAELLAELTAHKVEIIAALSAANDPIPSSAWLYRVARLLGIHPAVLLEGGHLEPNDLVELAGTDAGLVAYTIRASPAWINRPQRSDQPVEVHAAEEHKPQRTVHTAATASDAWREADAAYTNHLMSCRACHAATGRYCAAGADLRQRYNNTPMETSE
ncbi:hypothetical protein [Pseudomonas sp. PDM31]|uniref:hypothetical protein n=1 Tax=Pseudomonas sp. PDM31 TaxID=2854778 RepID=UPI001C466C51|nr:hypothetical protein [Pseudomonas sp. PDM31]MBV7477869.1 hypothetical protein [Pseudomonas sp. PDM31]